MTKAIWWIRRDLRLEDNPTLEAAMTGGRPVIPLFILDANLMTRPATPRQKFLMAGLSQLDKELRSSGSRLTVRSGNIIDTLRTVLDECGAEQIYAEEDLTPYARDRDANAARELPLALQAGVTVNHPVSVVKADGLPYTVFTPFSRAWKALPMPGWTHRAPVHFPPIPEPRSIPRDPADHNIPFPFPPGETEAELRLNRFLSGAIFDYHEGRNMLHQEGTSTLSPYLRFGMLSARRAVLAARSAAEQAHDPAARLGCETWLNELIWREFYNAILYHFPYVQKMAFRSSLRNIRWRESPTDLEAWQSGLTGYPIVDAAMRQLNETGWMHNRARMITASFLVKDLLINWQEGERWFMDHLVDGDPAANNGGWQWTAGVGTDAAPYFRVFNPIVQGEKFDPKGTYVRRWVPELQKVPLAYLQRPWTMPMTEQAAAGCRIGVDYPLPIVDHASARKRALDAYRASSTSNSS